MGVEELLYELIDTIVINNSVKNPQTGEFELRLEKFESSKSFNLSCNPSIFFSPAEKKYISRR